MLCFTGGKNKKRRGKIPRKQVKDYLKRGDEGFSHLIPNMTMMFEMKNQNDAHEVTSDDE